MWPLGGRVTLAWKKGVKVSDTDGLSMHTVRRHMLIHNHTNIHTFTACRAALEKNKLPYKCIHTL